jgi:hypothetical protein
VQEHDRVFDLGGVVLVFVLCAVGHVTGCATRPAVLDRILALI